MKAKVKKRLVYSGIAIIWLIIPAFETTMACVFTDIKDKTCIPDGVHGSHDLERAAHFFGFFMSSLLPLTLMIYFYTKLVRALHPKVCYRLLLTPNKHVVLNAVFVRPAYYRRQFSVIFRPDF